MVWTVLVSCAACGCGYLECNWRKGVYRLSLQCVSESVMCLFANSISIFHKTNWFNWEHDAASNTVCDFQPNFSSICRQPSQSSEHSNVPLSLDDHSTTLTETIVSLCVSIHRTFERTRQKWPSLTVKVRPQVQDEFIGAVQPLAAIGCRVMNYNEKGKISMKCFATRN